MEPDKLGSCILSSYDVKAGVMSTKFFQAIDINTWQAAISAFQNHSFDEEHLSKHKSWQVPSSTVTFINSLWDVYKRAYKREVVAFDKEAYSPHHPTLTAYLLQDEANLLDITKPTIQPPSWANINDRSTYAHTHSYIKLFNVLITTCHARFVRRYCLMT